MNNFVSSAVTIGSTKRTENGDMTFSTSLDTCVDLFFQIGALRGQKEDRIKGVFSAAYAENQDLATKISLWARDIRGGAGERQSFRIILKYLEVHDLDRLMRVLPLVPEVGRWDDLFSLVSVRGKNLSYDMIKKALQDGNGLCAKWMPREGTAKATLAKELREYLGLTPKQYRKTLVSLTKVVEQQMCAREWPAINYSHVPSVASARYGKAFGRHDQVRYAEYLESVKKGEKKINTGAVYPYDITKDGVPDDTADVMWNNLPEFVKEGQSFLPVIDVSGSMSSSTGGSKVSCLDVSVSLGIYLAERNKTAFNRLAMTFHTSPRFFQIPKGTIKEKVRFVKGSDGDMCGSTNLDKAMDMILEIAQKANAPQSDLPSHLLILSDMEFDGGGSKIYDYRKNAYVTTESSVSERTKQKFKDAGYEMPNIVWWNIQSRHGNTPVRYNEEKMALVSGFSPSFMKSLLGGDMNPVSQMMATVDIERYNH